MDLNLILEPAKALANSNFVTSVLGALAGAFGGAWAAQRISDRKLKRESDLSQLRSVNDASLLAYSICNGSINYKKQLTKPICEAYFSTVATIEPAIALQMSTPPQFREPIAVHLDLRTLSIFRSTAELLKDTVLMKINEIGKLVSLAIVLPNVCEAFNESIVTRNELVTELKNSNATELSKIHFYAGMTVNGHTDHRFYDNIEALSAQIDDIIFFSKEIGEILQEQAKKLSKGFEAKFGKPPIRLHNADYSSAYKEGLIPPKDNYESWETAFKAAKR